MGNVESLVTQVCGKKKKKSVENKETNNLENQKIAENEEKEEDIDDGILIRNDKDSYFKKEDFEVLRKKYPDFEEWVKGSLLKSKTRHKKIKWKEGNLIGTGSFGTVKMGLNLQTGSLMAVKQVQVGSMHVAAQQDRIKSLEMEIEVLSQLEHTAIVRYYGSQKTKTAFNIFLEYVSGGTIASLVEKYGALKENLIKVYTRQILEGLEYLHARNIIHRDIKGANVLVDNSGKCKLADFGTAKRISSIVDGDPKSMPSLRGTPNWMAPEVIKQSNFGRQSDIWSVGCTVLEMVTGKMPWFHLHKPNSTVMSVLYQIGSMKTLPPLPEGISPDASDFLKNCFKINPAERANVVKLLNHRFLVVVEENIEKPLPVPEKGKKRFSISFGSKRKESSEQPQPTTPQKGKELPSDKKYVVQEQEREKNQMSGRKGSYHNDEIKNGLKESEITVQFKTEKQEEKKDQEEEDENAKMKETKYFTRTLDSNGPPQYFSLNTKNDLTENYYESLTSKQVERHHKESLHIKINMDDSPPPIEEGNNKGEVSEVENTTIKDPEHIPRTNPAFSSKRRLRSRPLGAGKSDTIASQNKVSFTAEEDEVSSSGGRSRKSSGQFESDQSQSHSHIMQSQIRRKSLFSEKGTPNRRMSNLANQEGDTSNDKLFVYENMSPLKASRIDSGSEGSPGFPFHYRQFSSPKVGGFASDLSMTETPMSNQSPTSHKNKFSTSRQITLKNMGIRMVEVENDNKDTQRPFQPFQNFGMYQNAGDQSVVEDTTKREHSPINAAHYKERFAYKKGGRPFRSMRQIDAQKSFQTVDEKTEEAEQTFRKGAHDNQINGKSDHPILTKAHTVAKTHFPESLEFPSFRKTDQIADQWQEEVNANGNQFHDKEIYSTKETEMPRHPWKNGV